MLVSLNKGRQLAATLKNRFCTNLAVGKDIMPQQPLHSWFAQKSIYFLEIWKQRRPFEKGHIDSKF